MTLVFYIQRTDGDFFGRDGRWTREQGTAWRTTNRERAGKVARYLNAKALPVTEADAEEEEETSGGSYDAVHSALCTRVCNVRMDLVATYGMEAVMQEIENKASTFAEDELEEIGSSDVSCWIMDIEESLKREKP